MKIQQQRIFSYCFGNCAKRRKIIGVISSYIKLLTIAQIIKETNIGFSEEAFIIFNNKLEIVKLDTLELTDNQEYLEVVFTQNEADLMNHS